MTREESQARDKEQADAIKSMVQQLNTMIAAASATGLDVEVSALAIESINAGKSQTLYVTISRPL